MRIAITHPFCWPYVRRGNERNIEELATWLTRRGHEVVTLSSYRGPRREEFRPYGRRVLHRGAAFPPLRLDDRHFFLLSSLRTLRNLASDVVHSWYFTDGLAASLARPRAGHLVIQQINGVPVPGYSCYRVFPPEAWIFREAARRADRTVACSRFIRDLAAEAYGVHAEVIPPPVNMDRYTLGAGPPDGREVLLAVADFSVRRKGARVLIDAFQRLDRRGAVLRLAGSFPDSLQRALLDGLPESVRNRIQVMGQQDASAIAALYRESSLLVLPAMWEPSGTVLIEALSAGVPVVATAHAGIPEFVSPEVGVLFDPRGNGEETSNTAGLCEALEAGLALARRSGIRRRCREHAARFSWSALGPRIEQVYGVRQFETTGAAT